MYSDPLLNQLLKDKQIIRRMEKANKELKLEAKRWRRAYQENRFYIENHLQKAISSIFNDPLEAGEPR